MSGTRVVLVKPGDVLVFGRAGELDAATVDGLRLALERLKADLGLARIALFEQDIDLAVVSNGEGS